MGACQWPWMVDYNHCMHTLRTFGPEKPMPIQFVSLTLGTEMHTSIILLSAMDQWSSNYQSGGVGEEHGGANVSERADRASAWQVCVCVGVGAVKECVVFHPSLFVSTNRARPLQRLQTSVARALFGLFVCRSTQLQSSTTLSSTLCGQRRLSPPAHTCAFHANSACTTCT
jgi:hypothetical protein